MAFANLQTRLDLWNDHLTAAKARLASVETDFPAADAALRGKITANEADSVRTAAAYVAFYEKQLSEI